MNEEIPDRFVVLALNARWITLHAATTWRPPWTSRDISAMRAAITVARNAMMQEIEDSDSVMHATKH